MLDKVFTFTMFAEIDPRECCSFHISIESWMNSDDKHKNLNHSNYKFFLLQPGLRTVCHGDGVDGRTVVLGHVHLREHSDVVVFERRHDEGLVPKLLAHHLHDPVRSCVSQALAEAGESQQAGHAHMDIATLSRES